MRDYNEMKARTLVSRRTHVTTMDGYDVVNNGALTVFLPVFTPRFRLFVQNFLSCIFRIFSQVFCKIQRFCCPSCLRRNNCQPQIRFLFRFRLKTYYQRIFQRTLTT